MFSDIYITNCFDIRNCFLDIWKIIIVLWIYKILFSDIRNTDIQNNYFGYLENWINVKSACHIVYALHGSRSKLIHLCHLWRWLCVPNFTATCSRLWKLRRKRQIRPEGKPTFNACDVHLLPKWKFSLLWLCIQEFHGYNSGRIIYHY